MKKVLLSMAAVALLFTACSEDSKEIDQEQQIDMSDFYVYTDSDEASKQANGKSNEKSCHAMVNLNRQLNLNPGLEKKMYDVEYHTRKFLAGKGKPPKGGGGSGGSGDSDVDVQPIQDNLGIINIPVYRIMFISFMTSALTAILIWWRRRIRTFKYSELYFLT